MVATFAKTAKLEDCRFMARLFGSSLALIDGGLPLFVTRKKFLPISQHDPTKLANSALCFWAQETIIGSTGIHLINLLF